MALVAVKTMRFSFSVCKINLLKRYYIKVSLTSGISDTKIGQKSGNFVSNIASKDGKIHTDFCPKDGIRLH